MRKKYRAQNSKLQRRYCNMLKNNITALEKELEELFEQRSKLIREIELYEEDWMEYEKEELKEIERKIAMLINTKEELENELLELDFC